MRLNWLVGLVAAGLAGCGAKQEACEGAEGCACFANDSCMAGLSCLSHLCVDDSRHDPDEPREPSEVDSSTAESESTESESSEPSNPTEASSTVEAGIASNPSRWFRADEAVSHVDGVRIERWNDQSGNDADGIMNDPPRQPEFVAEGLNGKPEVTFSGTQSVYFPTFESMEFTLFAVGHNSDLSNYHSIIIGPGGDTGNNQLRWDNGDTLMFVGLDINIPVTTFPFGDTRVPHLVSVRYDGRLLEAFRNTELKGEFETVSTGLWDVAQLGGWFSSDFMIGTLSEVVMYDRSLTDAELQATQAALLEKYGL